MKPTAIRVGAGALAVTALSGCGSGGDSQVPASSSTAAAGITTSQASTAPTTTTPDETAPSLDMPVYGVEPTTTRALAPGEVTCPQPAGPTVAVHNPAPGSPTLSIGIPQGFTAAAPGGEAVKLTGPAGMTAEITLRPTTRTARDDFEQYSSDRVAKYSINSVSVIPGDLCGYSGQELIGILAEQPGKGIEYADRIVHVWTNSGDFLAVVRLEAPGGTPGFDDARSAMLADFGITMPG